MTRSQRPAAVGAAPEVAVGVGAPDEDGDDEQALRTATPSTPEPAVNRSLRLIRIPDAGPAVVVLATGYPLCVRFLSGTGKCPGIPARFAG
ncbi:hypothetical protein Abr02nite_58800 [Paractinoplanes brasiliensis]|nr:hypothetical protein Abr02nite_58800 [Actinoplanes brasiliensis]